jgi:purine catabolism regulator
MGTSPQEGIVEWIDALASYAKADLRHTVRAYLAHRGQWDRAAAALGIHRNTLRYRIATASRLIDNDLDNPDVAAPLWLSLRDYVPSANV